MTIALTMKVNDGVVLAADSASTLMGATPGAVVNVYNNANKIFNLRKGLPIDKPCGRRARRRPPLLGGA